MFICNFSCLFILLILQGSVTVRGYEKENEELDSEIDRIVKEYRNYASHKEDNSQENLHKVNNFEIPKKHISVRDNEEVNAEVNNTDKKQPPPPVAHRHTGQNPKQPVHTGDSKNMFALYAIVAGCSVAGLVGLIFAGVCWYRLQKNVKAASEAGYPAYGVTGPSNERVTSPGDRKLAQSAQMYHYQHQKQQMIAMEKANGEMKNDGSDEDSDEENEEGDYTVYECPGLAPTGEMEVKNPLFSEDMTPATPATPSPAVEQPAKK